MTRRPEEESSKPSKNNFKTLQLERARHSIKKMNKGNRKLVDSNRIYGIEHKYKNRNTIKEV